MRSKRKSTDGVVAAVIFGAAPVAATRRRALLHELHMLRAASRGASLRAGRYENPQDLGSDTTGACPAAHERAVMTVRLTLLLVIVGGALLLFTGPDGVLPWGQEVGGVVERPR